MFVGCTYDSENSYIKAIGMLRTFNDKRSVKANRIIKIDDFNEVTHHILYCVHTKLLSQRGKSLQTSSTASTRLPAQVRSTARVRAFFARTLTGV